MPLEPPTAAPSPDSDAVGNEWEATAKSPAILLVTSNPSVESALVEPLKEAGFELQRAESGRAALQVLSGTPAPGLVILDLALPDIPPREFFSAVRGHRALSQLPVIVVTIRDTEADRVVAFELGADDVVVAPFSAREILLRIRVQLRRRAGRIVSTGVLEIGPLKLDRDSHRVWLEGEPVPLSVREFRLLQAMMERNEKVLSRRLLLDLAWGANANVGVRAVDAYVTRLRRKLGRGREYIETVSSVGYRLKRYGDPGV